MTTKEERKVLFGPRKRPDSPRPLTLDQLWHRYFAAPAGSVEAEWLIREIRERTR